MSNPLDRKRGPSTHSGMLAAKREVLKPKKIKASVIFNVSTHRMIKAMVSTQGGTISDLMEELAYNYLKEHGKV
jgi:hypothetical protein